MALHTKSLGFFFVFFFVFHVRDLEPPPHLCSMPGLSSPSIYREATFHTNCGVRIIWICLYNASLSVGPAIRPISSFKPR